MNTTITNRRELVNRIGNHGNEVLILTCAEVWQQVSEYVDGMLTIPMREEVARHLARCPGCTAVVDGVRNVVRLAASDKVYPLPSGFSERMKKRLGRDLS